MTLYVVRSGHNRVIKNLLKCEHVLNETEREMADRLRKKLMEMEGTIKIYHEELAHGRFRPRRGERWERTVEKHLVTAAGLLGKSSAQLLDGFFELLRMNSLAVEAKMIGEDTGIPSEIA
jgi:hypothetical protein